MRAVVLDGPSGQLHVTTDLPEPAAAAGQVVVAVTAVGICGSDLSMVAGKRPPPRSPWVPGHETLGRIAAVGAGVDPRRVGERVVVEPNFPCLRCRACRAGRTSACPDRQVLGFTVPGTLVERIAVPAAFAWPVPAGCTDEDGVCVEPLAVAMAALRRTDPAPGASALVVGAGSQGALVCLALLARGIVPAVIEPHLGRRALALQLGARPCGSAEDGFEYVVETSGAPGALGAAVDRTAPGATVVLIGQSMQPAAVVTQTVVQRQLTLRGSLIYDHPVDFPLTLAALGPGLAPARLLQACYPMEAVATAFAGAAAVPGKTWIRVSE